LFSILFYVVSFLTNHGFFFMSYGGFFFKSCSYCGFLNNSYMTTHEINSNVDVPPPSPRYGSNHNLDNVQACAYEDKELELN